MSPAKNLPKRSISATWMTWYALDVKDVIRSRMGERNSTSSLSSWVLRFVSARNLIIISIFFTKFFSFPTPSRTLGFRLGELIEVNISLLTETCREDTPKVVGVPFDLSWTKSLELNSRYLGLIYFTVTPLPSYIVIHSFAGNHAVSRIGAVRTKCS